MELKIEFGKRGEMIRTAEWYMDDEYLRYDGRADWCLIPLEIITSIMTFNQKRGSWKVLWKEMEAEN